MIIIYYNHERNRKCRIFYDPSIYIMYHLREATSIKAERKYFMLKEKKNSKLTPDQKAMLQEMLNNLNDEIHEIETAWRKDFIKRCYRYQAEKIYESTLVYRMQREILKEANHG